MSRVKDRLLQYKKDLERQTQYKAGLPGSALDIVNTLLADLEEDEKVNGWIPVTEKLPDTSEFVLTALKVTNSSGCDYSIGRSIRQNGKKCWLDDFYGILNSESKYQVVAWRPLPESYKEE